MTNVIPLKAVTPEQLDDDSAVELGSSDPASSSDVDPLEDDRSSLPEAPEKRGKGGEEGSSGVEASAMLPPSPVLPLFPSPPPQLAPADCATVPPADDIFTPAPSTNPVLDALREKGLYGRSASDGEHIITCPWVSEHSDEALSETTYSEPTIQRPFGGFVCPHAHKDTPHIATLLDQLDVSAETARCKPRIRNASGEMIRIVALAERMLASLGHYYQSGGVIVSIETDDRGNLYTRVTDETTLTRALATACDWDKFDGQKKSWVRCDPPPRIVTTLLKAGNYEHLPVLDALARQPYFRNGSDELVVQPGYDPESRTYAAFAGDEFPMPEPSKEAAHDALDELKNLLTEFHFASDIDRAAALVAILTAAVRATLSLAPAFNISASTPGSGKSYFGSLVASFGGPDAPMNLSYPTNAEEASKAMLAALISKPAVICFDDMQTDWLPHGMINRTLTSEFVADRILGSSRTVQVGTNTFVMGTGNNVSPVRDMCRRVVTITLRPPTGAPATLRYEGRPVETVKAARGRYVALAMSIIRAWNAAGKPRSDVCDIATFGAWSDMCRQPLLWLGEPDPATSLIEQVNNDPDAELLGRLLAAWYAKFGRKPTMIRTVLQRAGEDKHGDLHDALMELPIAERESVNPNKLGWYLKRNTHRLVDGMHVEPAHSSERKAWSVISTKLNNPRMAIGGDEEPDVSRTWLNTIQDDYDDEYSPRFPDPVTGKIS